MPLSEFAPYILELPQVPDVERAFLALARHDHCLFLDSALGHPDLGRYSFLTADPFAFLQVAADGRDGLTELAACLNRYRTASLKELPPFQGGAAGLVGYDLSRSLERVPRPRFDEFGIPALAIGLYDVLLAIDHHLDQAWIVSQGFPEQQPQQRAQRARQRAAEFRRWIESPGASSTDATALVGAADGAGAAVSRDALAPQFPVPGPAGLTSNFAADEYRRTVQRVVDYICAGDVFQVNLAQRLLYPARDAATSLYLRLRRATRLRSPATSTWATSRSSARRPNGSCRFGKAKSRLAPSREPVNGWAARGRLIRGRRFAAQRERPSRERDDRRSVAQRSVARLLAGQRLRDAIVRPGSLSVRPASGVRGHGAVARKRRRRWTCCAARFPAARSPVPRKSEPWRLSPNWNRPPGAPIAARWATSALTARPT
jgi:hypothetical protein